MLLYGSISLFDGHNRTKNADKCAVEGTTMQFPGAATWQKGTPAKSAVSPHEMGDRLTDKAGRTFSPLKSNRGLIFIAASLPPQLDLHIFVENCRKEVSLEMDRKGN